MHSGETLGAAIRSALELKGTTQAHMANYFGIRQSSITGWLQRGTISKSRLPMLWSYFADVVGPDHWGLAGTLASGSLPAGSEPDADVYVEIRRVRLKLSAGATGFAVDFLDDEDAAPLWFRRSWLEGRGLRADRLLALSVTGSSMEPGLYEGDTVLINTASTTPRDSAVYAVNYEGEPVIKRLLRDAGQWWLTSDNPDKTHYPHKLCDEHSVIVGEVVHKQSIRI